MSTTTSARIDRESSAAVLRSAALTTGTTDPSVVVACVPSAPLKAGRPFSPVDPAHPTPPRSRAGAASSAESRPRPPSVLPPPPPIPARCPSRVPPRHPPARRTRTRPPTPSRPTMSTRRAPPPRQKRRPRRTRVPSPSDRSRFTRPFRPRTHRLPTPCEAARLGRRRTPGRGRSRLGTWPAADGRAASNRMVPISLFHHVPPNRGQLDDSAPKANGALRCSCRWLVEPTGNLPGSQRIPRPDGSADEGGGNGGPRRACCLSHRESASSLIRYPRGRPPTTVCAAHGRQVPSRDCRQQHSLARWLPPRGPRRPCP